MNSRERVQTALSFEEPDYAHALMDKVMRFPPGAGRKLAELGADTPRENIQAFYEDGRRTPSESFRGTVHRNQEEGD
jgi:hypothetical protein